MRASPSIPADLERVVREGGAGGMRTGGGRLRRSTRCRASGPVGRNRRTATPPQRDDMAFWHGLVDLVYPPRCLLCARPPRLSRDHFCEDCADAIFNDLHLVCPRCAATVGPHAVYDGRCVACRIHAPDFDSAVRLGLYEGPLQQAVLRIGKRLVHEGLAELLGERWADSDGGQFTSLGVQVVVPVPLHWWRRLRRGYNQSAAVAHGLAGTLGLPCRWWLRRTRNTPSQKAACRSSGSARRASAMRFVPGQRARLMGQACPVGG